LKGVVLDASVAAKWVLPSALEPHSGNALRILDDYTRKKLEIVVPDLFWAELGNLLWKAVRTGRLNIADAAAGLRKVTVNPFVTISTFSLLDSALAIANESGRSFYDCLYVALADSSSIDFVTADEKLVNALGPRYPVRWLALI